jgi:GPH family glycoside/pentoside/hexuronide:cation symporter
MKKLSIGTKLAYASGGLALNFANLLISQWLLRLYVPSENRALVAPFLFSLIFLTGRIVDGITDPLTGFLSDTFRSRWGRRKPFIVLALLPTALVSGLMWFPPDPGTLTVGNGIFIFVLVQLFFIFWTLLANPYMSMIPELTQDPKERIDITTLQAVFLMIGTVLSAVIGNIKQTWGWGGLGITVAVVTVIAFLPTIFFVREPANGRDRSEVNDTRHERNNILLWIGTTFRNPPFVFLLAATSLFWFALNIMILLVPFWVEHVTGRGDAEVLFVMIPYILANVLMFFPVNALSKKWGKRPVFLGTLAVSGIASLSLVLVGRIGIDPFLHTQIIMALYGLSTAGFLMLPNALLADVVDFDAERTGRRREAIHFGVQAFFQKVAIGLSIVVSSALMFSGGRGEPTIAGLKLVAVAAGTAGLASAGIFLFYRLKSKTN